MFGINDRPGTGICSSCCTPGSVLAMPGGSFAVPRVTLYDGEDIGPRTVVIRYGAEPSSAIMKLIVVSVVELPKLVRVAMLAVALLP